MKNNPTAPSGHVGSGDLLGVSVYDGKYTIQCDGDGGMRALRYGQPWRDLTGDGMVLALVQEIQSLREQLADLIEGRCAVLPKTEKHAKELLLVAEACLRNLSSPNIPGSAAREARSL